MPIDWDEAPKRERTVYVDVSTHSAALDLLDWWIRSHRRLEVAHSKALFEIDYYRSLLTHLDPYLPAFLQDADRRAANADLYRVIAESTTQK